MHQLYPTDSPGVLVALRELYSHDPEAIACGAEGLASRLRPLTDRKPATFEVEAALEALRLDSGEVTA